MITIDETSNLDVVSETRDDNEGDNYHNKIDADDHTNGLWKRVDVPSPLHLIVDYNMERNSVVYEVSLGRQIGLDIVPGRHGLAMVEQVLPGSRAERIGIQCGDVIVASSATAGEKMWSHDSVDGIKSALSTRFVMSASVKIRFERALDAIPTPVARLLKVPHYFNVVVKRPIGLHVEESDSRGVVVTRVTPELGAARSRRIEPGDQIVAMSASWGDQMWEVTSVESFVVGVRMRTDPQLTFRLKRVLPLTAYRSQLEARMVHSRGGQRAPYPSHTPASVMSVPLPVERVAVPKQLTEAAQTLTYTDGSYSLPSSAGIRGGERDASAESNVGEPDTEAEGDRQHEDAANITTYSRVEGEGDKSGSSDGAQPHREDDAVSQIVSQLIAEVGAEPSSASVALKRPASPPSTSLQTDDVYRGTLETPVNFSSPSLQLHLSANSDTHKHGQKHKQSPPELAATSPSSRRSINDQIDATHSSEELAQLWLGWSPRERSRLKDYDLNKLMSVALDRENPGLAVAAFEDLCGYVPPVRDPVATVNRLARSRDKETSSALFWATQTNGSSQFLWSPSDSNGSLSSNYSQPHIKPNNFLCTTAIKAYGRNNEPDKAASLLPWFESLGGEPDIYLLSALVYVCAKSRRLQPQAEHLFWTEIPRRNLNYTVATTNSMMYMYARQNRPDDALKVYDMAKGLGLTCTVVTYGVLIKALLRSGKKKLQEASFDILRSLPDVGISPGVVVYNQFLEHFSNTHDYRNAKLILKLMTRTKPRVQLDSLSYSYLINCFADAHKPRSALAVYRQMRSAGFNSNPYTYMGVLKALTGLRDGVSSVQVLTEMRDRGLEPDERHISMAMFTCVKSDMPELAESIFSIQFLKDDKDRFGSRVPQTSTRRPRPDTALFTLYLRSLMQQGKWAAAESVFERMLAGRDAARPNGITLNYVLQYEMQAGRWERARRALDIITDGFVYANNAKSTASADLSLKSTKEVARLRGDRSLNHFPVRIPSLQGTFQALSLALGPYSKVVLRLQEEESMRAQRTELALRGEDSIYIPPVAYESSIASKLERPGKETLEFLVQSARRLGELPRGFLQGYFYAELLRALAMEGEPAVAESLLDLLPLVRVKAEERDGVAASVELVKRLGEELGKLKLRASATGGASATAGASRAPQAAN